MSNLGEGSGLLIREAWFESTMGSHGTCACAMTTERLAEVFRSLTPQEQEAVLQFIDYLKRRDDLKRSQSPFLQAADEFIAQHPELLQRLAQ